MKVTKLTIKNIGKIADTVIELNKPLILFYGEIRQGKTTILNAVRWVCGGKFPDDIIRHGEKEASVELGFDGGCISRSWYRAKDNTTKARDISYVVNGKPQGRPAEKVRALLNPFLLDQDFLRNKTELERKQYFSELFAVDTTELDTELFNIQRDAQSLRSKISGYGEIDLTKAEMVDAADLRASLEKIRGEHSQARQAWDEQCRAIYSAHGKAIAAFITSNAAIQSHNASVDRKLESLGEVSKQIARLKAQLSEAEQQEKEAAAWLKANPKQEASEIPSRASNPPEPPAPDTSDLEAKIQNAAAQNVRAEQYAKNKKRADYKKADEQSLSAMEKRQREIKAEKMAKLKTVSDSCGIEGLSFDEAGNFIYQDTTAGMISDSQIMRLSSELSALYPEGFGLDLVDRAESLGKSIFEFVERAKREEKTILATIVGERPAKVPDDIGVFVVKEGKVEA
jgi:predicted ATP-dependent endonuclease of OLD family